MRNFIPQRRREFIVWSSDDELNLRLAIFSCKSILIRTFRLKIDDDDDDGIEQIKRVLLLIRNPLNGLDD